MKNKTVKALALLMAVATVSVMGPSSIYASEEETATTEAAAEETEAAGEESADADQQAADNAAALIDKIYVQERTETTDTAKLQKKPGMRSPMHRKNWWKARMPARITSAWTPEMLQRMMPVMQMRSARMNFW